MTQTETTQAARVRLHGIIDNQLPHLAGTLKTLADVLLEHAEALARQAEAAKAEQGDKVFNRKEVAIMLSCSASTVDNLVKRGELKHTQRWSGGPKCFTREQIREYVERLNERGEGYVKIRRK